jgi:sugar O-acyltransferase (sialic acid O-acetyltransferase NeuD family)
MPSTSPNKNLVIFGSWYLADVIEELATSIGWNVVGRIDPDPPDHIQSLSEVPPRSPVFVAIGNRDTRNFVSDQLRNSGRHIVTIIHPSAIVSPSANVGYGCYIGENVVLRARVTLGNGVLLNAGAIVSHHCQVDDFTTLGPNAAMASRSKIGRCALIGVGAAILPGCKVGKKAIVGGGAVVCRDVGEHNTVVGNPARVIDSSDHGIPDNQSDWKNNSVW